MSAPVFASVSGTVKAIEPRHVATGDLVNSIIIENDGEMKETDFHGVEDVASLSKEQIIEKSKRSRCSRYGRCRITDTCKALTKGA